jgi:hypothetical protein
MHGHCLSIVEHGEHYVSMACAWYEHGGVRKSVHCMMQVP